MRGKTLGILGLGRLGSQMAAYGRAFEMRMLAWSPHLTPERALAEGAECVAMDDLLRQSDVVTIHLPLVHGTRNLIASRELSLMKSGAILVNTSRADIVSQEALLAALRERRIGGAGMDVFDIEPLPEHHPFRNVENTVLTPHIGYFTREMLTVYYEDAVEAILAFLDRRPIRTLNPQALGHPRQADMSPLS